MTKVVDKLSNKSNKIVERSIIEHLESSITDEMILNSFVRDLKVLQLGEKVILNASSESAVKTLNANYKAQILEAVIKSYKEVPVEITFGKESLVVENTIEESKYISPKFTFNNYVQSPFNEEATNTSVFRLWGLCVFAGLACE